MEAWNEVVIFPSVKGIERLGPDKRRGTTIRCKWEGWGAFPCNLRASRSHSTIIMVMETGCSQNGGKLGIGFLNIGISQFFFSSLYARM